MTWQPFYIRLDGLRAAVFGGGTVATRRALMLARSGALVDVYSLDFTPELVRAAEEGNPRLHRVDLREADPRSLIGDALIVVVATSDEEVNEKILGAALEMGRLVNYPPRGTRGNLIVPFRGETSYGLRFAVTSLGETGVGARRARDRVLEVLESDESVRNWYEAMRRVKTLLKARVGDYKLRYRLYFVIERDPEFASLVESGRIREALERAERIIGGALGSSGGRG